MSTTATKTFFATLRGVLFIPEHHYIDRLRKGYSLEEMGEGWCEDTHNSLDDDVAHRDLWTCRNIRNTMINQCRFFPHDNIHELLDILSVDIYDDITPVINKEPGDGEIEIIRFYATKHGIVCVLKPGFGNFLVSNDKPLLAKIISLLTDYAFNNLQFGADVKYQLLKRNL